MIQNKPYMKTACIFLCIVCAGLLISFFLPLGDIRFAAAASLVVAAVVVCFLIKKRSILSFNRRKILLLFITSVAVFLMLYYVSGLFCGFYQAVYRFSFDTLWRYILPILAIVVASEVIRHLSLAVDGKAVTILTYLLCILSDLAIENGFLYFNTVHGFMDFIGMTLFHSITANLLLNYTSKCYGMLPCILYRSVLFLYPYFIPVIPNTPEIIPAFALLLMPLFILFFIKGLFERKKPVAKQKKSAWHYVGSSCVAILLLSFVMLISCQFRYGIIVIGTGSMSDEINRGDAVVFEAREHCEIEENDVIIFQKDNETRVVHRVIEIQKINGQTRYITKGDANRDVDFGYVTEDQVIGVVRFKVLYIGFPSLWLKDIFNK